MSELFSAAELPHQPAVPNAAPPEINLFGEAMVAEAELPAAISQNVQAYRVLARKYRPRTFAELIGQEVVVQTLTNAIRTNRLAQAWMLTGVRGVGKTTTARIIARALNCIGADGHGEATIEPCGVCSNCIAIAADRHVDVLEMDAASRTGVDDIREIIDGVRYNPVNARYKIYIIDEVHMLTKNAFNALLKTLEEPPPHVKFIFATTEIRKVPVTVLSRCQRFDLRRVEADTLAQHFVRIASLENTNLEPDAAMVIARAADGSVRDGLSLLDQAIARCDGQVTTAIVHDMVGLADRAQLMTLTRHTLRGEMAKALGCYAELLQNGADSLVVLQDVAELVHLLTRAVLVPNAGGKVALPELEQEFITATGGLGVPALTRAWQIILKGIEEVQRAPNAAQAAEMVLIRLAFAASLPSPADLVRKLQQDAPPTNTSSANSGATPAGNRSTVTQLRTTAEHGNVAAMAAPPVIVPPPAYDAMPQDFPALVALCAHHKEMQLYTALSQAVELVEYQSGKLVFHPLPAAPKSLAQQLKQCLTKWTDTAWQVIETSQKGEPPLAVTAATQAKARHEAVLAHPLVQQALAHFPAAKLIAVRPPPIALATLVNETAMGDEATAGALTELSAPPEAFDEESNE